MWITGDVELPQEVVDAHASGQLVFFVGAGASMDSPSSLPSFKALAKTLAEKSGTEFSEGGGLDFFLGSLPSNFDTHRIVRDEIARPESLFNPTHTAIVELAAHSGAFRVVTTNFDTHLQDAAEHAKVDIPDIWHSPALPLGSDHLGLVHLHGSVARAPEELIVTDRDFGRAYLTEAWAPRFLLPMFDNHTVVFVGYSHEDTIMRYLSLGLPSKTRRYAFTDDPEHPKWTRLSVTPIGYTLRGEHDHSNLVNALQIWAQRAKMGALEHDALVRGILGGDAGALPLPERDYLIAQVHTEDGARRFANLTNEVRWLRWLEGVDVFADLFRGGPAHESSVVLAEWFSRFIGSPETSDAALHTVRRLGRRFSDALVWAAGRATEALGRADADRGQRWRTLLTTSIEGLTAPGDPGAAVRFRRSGVAEPPGVIRAVLRPFLSLERNWFTADGDDVRPPSAELGWSVRERDLHQMVVEFAEQADPSAPGVLTLLEDAMNGAYELAAAYDRTRPDLSLRFSRQRIESQPARYLKYVDALIDGLRILGERALAISPDLADRWWQFEHSLFRRLAVHLVRFDPGRTPDQKLQWLLGHDALYAPGIKHETYLALEEALPSASDDALVVLLDGVRAGPNLPDGIEDPARRGAYMKFNLLVWLTRHAPGWGGAAAELARMQEAHPNFAPREHPDLDFTTSTGTWGGVLPMAPDEMVGLVEGDGAAAALAAVLRLDYSERNFNEPTWEDALSLFRQVAATHPGVGLDLNQALDPAETPHLDIRKAIAYGWADADLSADLQERVIAAMSDQSLLNDSPRTVSVFLEKQIQRLVDEPGTPFTASLRALAGDLLDRNLDDAEAVPDDGDGPTLALQSWPGHLAIYWLTEIDQRWRSDRSGWDGLDEAEEHALKTLLGTAATQAGARPAVTSETYFLFAADEGFTTEHVVPLFTDPATAVSAWRAFLYRPRVTDRMLQAGMFEALLRMWEHLPALVDRGLDSNFLSLSAAIASLGGIPADDRRRLRFTSVIAADGAHAAEFAREVARDIESDKTDANAAWTLWLREHVGDRLYGVPRNATPDELAAWADIVPILGEAVPEAVELFAGRAPGFDDNSVVDVPPDAVRTHGSVLVGHLVERCANSPASDAMVGFRVAEVIDGLRDEVGSDLLMPLVSAAEAKGYIPRP